MVEYACYHFNELSKQDLYHILKIRQEVFVVEQDCPYLDADGIDLKSYHVVGKLDGKVVACTRIVPAGISYTKYASIGRVVNLPIIRRTGEGKRLMTFSIKKCLEFFPESQIKISAQVYLNQFYTGLGFEATGDKYLEDGIPHESMIYKN